MPKKTPGYVRNAVDKYNQKFDRVYVNFPKGTKDRIKKLTGKSCNAFCNEVITAELQRLEGSAPAADHQDNDN